MRRILKKNLSRETVLTDAHLVINFWNSVSCEYRPMLEWHSVLRLVQIKVDDWFGSNMLLCPLCVACCFLQSSDPAVNNLTPGARERSSATAPY